MWAALMTPTRVPRLFFMHMQMHMAIPAMTPMMNTIPNTIPAIAVPLGRKTKARLPQQSERSCTSNTKLSVSSLLCLRERVLFIKRNLLINYTIGLLYSIDKKN